MKLLNEFLASVQLFSCMVALVYVLAVVLSSMRLCAHVPPCINGSQDGEESETGGEEIYQRT